MNLAARLLVLALAFALGQTVVTASSTRTGRYRFSGRNYVRLGDWARANEFAIQWLERDKSLQLSNRVARLMFNVDSRQDLRRAQINGLQVWLAFPLIYQNGSAYIAQTDLEETIAPVLSPPANPNGIRIKTICIDPGHGGSDPGYRVGSREEKRYTLLLAQELKEQLEQSGFDVVLTRTTDVKVPLDMRTEVARRSKADLFVSLHFNAYPPAPEVKGIEVYCCTPAGATSFNAGGEGDTRWVAGNRNDEKNMLLAYQVLQSIRRKLPSDDRGVKRARYQVLREASMPAILIEGGFMSNASEGKKIFDPAYRHQMARAIADGLLVYKKIVKG